MTAVSKAAWLLLLTDCQSSASQQPSRVTSLNLDIDCRLPSKRMLLASSSASLRFRTKLQLERLSIPRQRLRGWYITQSLWEFLNYESDPAPTEISGRLSIDLNGTIMRPHTSTRACRPVVIGNDREGEPSLPSEAKMWLQGHELEKHHFACKPTRFDKDSSREQHG